MMAREDYEDENVAVIPTGSLEYAFFFDIEDMKGLPCTYLMTSCRAHHSRTSGP